MEGVGLFWIDWGVVYYCYALSDDSWLWCYCFGRGVLLLIWCGRKVGGFRALSGVL